MEDIKSLAAESGNSIPTILMPTIKILTPYLLANSSNILSVPSTTHTYGPHPRQQLDIYASEAGSSSPILVYFYGGGLTRGDKILPMLKDGLVYHNLGSFFAKRGITTIIPDYRRVDSELGGEGAVFPSGGEDMSLVLKWLGKSGGNVPGDQKKVFLMGNSAGGLHIATYLLEPRWFEERKNLCAGTGEVALKGAVEVGVPFNFNAASSDRKQMLNTYYGSDEDVKAKCPQGLLEAIRKTGKSREESAVPKFLILASEFDPEDEIVKPNEAFVELMEKAWGEKVEVGCIKGHNHISPPMVLSTGEGEKWGEEVVEWIKS